MAKILPCGRRFDGLSLQETKTSPVSLETVVARKLDAFLTAKTLNRSTSRENTLEVILSFKKHFSIPELVEAILKRFPKIGAASVYRNIPIFIEAGILCESFSDNFGQPLYEVDKEHHHDHIVCIDCNAIFEFFDETIEKAQDRVTFRLGFKPERHRHVVYAHCKKLTEKEDS